jgi:hypothetical protein
MYFVTPTYFRPMVESVVGWLMLIILSTIVGVGYRLVGAAIWLLREGRVVFGLLVLVGYSVTWLVAVWIVLLGPAALFLLEPRS